MAIRAIGTPQPPGGRSRVRGGAEGIVKSSVGEFATLITVFEAVSEDDPPSNVDRNSGDFCHLARGGVVAEFQQHVTQIEVDELNLAQPCRSLSFEFFDHDVFVPRFSWCAAVDL